MRLSTLILSISFCALALVRPIAANNNGEDPQVKALVEGHSHKSRAMSAGPSGTLIKPVGGAVFKNHAGDVGNVEVIYRGVSDGSNTHGARTCTIDLHLVPKDPKAQAPSSFNLSSPSVRSLASGMRPHDSGSSQPIWANFVPPAGACGDYHLVVYERQLYEVKQSSLV